MANEFEKEQKKAGLALAEEVKNGNPINEILFEKYRKCDGLTLAGLVRERKITPSKLLDIALFRTESVQPENNSEKQNVNAVNVNAVIYLEEMKKQALLTAARLTEESSKPAAESSLPGGTFKGVPFLLKDSAKMAGVPFSEGSEAYKCLGLTSEKDSDIVKCYKDAGLVIFGKTNMPEFALKAETNNEAWGPTLNPWNTEYSPGGSSGGSAAAVAVGIVPVAHGADKGGSIRIPSSCTGLFGLKPSNLTIYGKGFGADHVISRSVRDSAAMLDLILSRPPKRSFLEEVKKGKEEINDRSKKRFKIKYWALENNNPYDVKMEGENAVQEAVQEAVTLLRNLGHDLDKEEGPIISIDQYNDLSKLGFIALCLNVKRDVGKLISAVREKFEKLNEEEVNIKVEEAIGNLELETRYLLKLTEVIDDKLIGRYMTLKNDIIEKINKVFEEEKTEREEDKVYDFYLTPTLARFPFKKGEVNPKPWEHILLLAVADGNPADGTPIKINDALLGEIKDAQAPEWVVEKMEGSKDENLCKFLIDDLLSDKDNEEKKDKKPWLCLQIAKVKEQLSLAPWAILANMTGNPTASVPLHWAEKENLPVGIQLMAAYGREDLLFRLAGQLEEAESLEACTVNGAVVFGTISTGNRGLTEKAGPWFERVPPLDSP